MREKNGEKRVYKNEWRKSADDKETGSMTER